jgi:hypothetical protein
VVEVEEMEVEAPSLVDLKIAATSSPMKALRWIYSIVERNSAPNMGICRGPVEWGHNSPLDRFLNWLKSGFSCPQQSSAVKGLRWVYSVVERNSTPSMMFSDMLPWRVEVAELGIYRAPVEGHNSPKDLSTHESSGD